LMTLFSWTTGRLTEEMMGMIKYLEIWWGGTNVYEKLTINLKWFIRASQPETNEVLTTDSAEWAEIAGICWIEIIHWVCHAPW
jgi:hypothetical protein